jgi:hypothetical protein
MCRAERLKAYSEKKSKKPALIAKTSVLFDVKVNKRHLFLGRTSVQ